MCPPDGLTQASFASPCCSSVNTSAIGIWESRAAELPV
jgi:hypothetical protein